MVEVNIRWSLNIALLYKRMVVEHIALVRALGDLLHWWLVALNRRQLMERCYLTVDFGGAIWERRRRHNWKILLMTNGQWQITK